jgi:3-hydroxy-D-aspartate aldolase
MRMLPKSWRDIATPALVLDINALDRNIARAVRLTDGANLRLRPHAKAFKSATIARRLNAAGVRGFCCAKLGEVEALAAEGIDDFLVTSPIVTPQAIRRLMLQRAAGVLVAPVVDDPMNVAELEAAASASGIRLDVLLDVDVGQSRTGVAPSQAGALADQVRKSPSLNLVGLQGYAGQNQHIQDFTDRRAATEQSAKLLQAAQDQCRGAERDMTLSGGGTGTLEADAELGVLTEVQPGSFLFMDQQYGAVRGSQMDTLDFEPSLFVLTSVISRAGAGKVIVDAGFKAFGTDAGMAQIAAGAPDGTPYVWFGDEHGAVIWADGDTPSLGRQFLCRPPHCDTTVDRYDSFVAMVDAQPVGLWPIEARGKSQ